MARPPARSRARGILVGLVGAAGFSVVREVDGLRQGPLGVLYGPQYLVGGIAIHGSGSIPAVPASHGWARVTNGAMDMLWSSGLAPVVVC